MSGGSRVLVDQADQDRFSVDLPSIEVRRDDAGSVVLSIGYALADALMRDWSSGGHQVQDFPELGRVTLRRSILWELLGD
jgi:hypothetical protein